MHDEALQNANVNCELNRKMLSIKILDIKI